MRLPRDDVYAAARSRRPGGAHAYRSGFVTLVDLAPVASAARLEVELILTLGMGPRRAFPPGRSRSSRSCAPPDDTGGSGIPGAGPAMRVAICMATYEPPADLLRMQLDSIREQTHGELGVRDQRRLLIGSSPSRACGS